jgi:hypothetical protein
MRKSTQLLSAALVASAVLSAWSWLTLRTERDRNAELEAKLELQALELERVSSAAAPAVEMPDTTPVKTVSSNSIPASPSVAPSNSVVGGFKDWDANQRSFMRDPRYREARRAQDRLKYAPRRANLVRLLGFTPEQADATIDLDIDQDFRWEDENAIYATNEEARKNSRARAEVIMREHQDKLRSLLGEEKRQRLQGYMESRESRMQVDDLRSELTEVNALRDDQLEPLITALHAERAQMKSSLTEYRDTLSWEGDTSESARLYSERQTELVRAMNARMLSSAASILTQAQLRILETQLQQDLAEREARQNLSRIHMKLQQARVSATTN